MDEETQGLIEFAIANWTFIAAMLVFASIGMGMKRLVPAHPKGWRRWFRATMPVHPVIAGALLGLVPTVPAGIEASTAGRCLYFAMAGVFSTWAYSVVKQLLAKKGIVLESTPPAAPKDDADTNP